MGSNQSRNNSETSNNNDIEIVITEPEQSDNDDEYFECTSSMIESNVFKDVNHLENQTLKSDMSIDDHERKSNKDDDHTDTDDSSSSERKLRQQKEMEEFREEISKKRVLRQQCLKKIKEEMKDLNEKLTHQIMINDQLRETIDGCSDNHTSINEIKVENRNLKKELSESQMLLQKLNGENLNACIENQALRDHIRSLKEVNKAMKEMLAIREAQVDQLKSKLEEIEISFADKETKILSTDLKQEYQRQLENIRNMRALYEERNNLLLQENNVLKQQIGDKEHDLETEIQKSKKFEEYIATLESNLEVKNNDISELENQISQIRSDKLQTDEEMNAVNHLISQILFDFNSSGNSVNFDMLHNMLEENREFLKEMAMKEDFGGIDTGSFLPKVLYELFLQVHQNSIENNNGTGTNEKIINTPEEIALKLPKVWRILIELLSHQNKLKEENEGEIKMSTQDDCNKSVQTSSDSQAVLSVSKTFIRLRDLIFEKRSLQKDTTRLKTLYSHLEQRLDKQEKKLSCVSLELTKTWHLVGKIKRQHRQLHTHEQILCYQLQQKRRVLNELKAELEYCRKKWALARAINKESEIQCQEMRNEFLMRKIQDQNSAESGYSDEHQSDDENVKIENEHKKRFERNLSNFYRNPLLLIDSDRRRSVELPLLYYELITEKPSLFRAQSEPPCSNSKDYPDNEIYSIPDQYLEEKSQASCVSIEVDNLESFYSENVIVTLPPDVQESNKIEKTIKIRNKLERQKKHKGKRNQNGIAETAEEMFCRLNSSVNGETSTTSTSEGINEELENIEEIPLDNIQDTFEPQNDFEKSVTTSIDSEFQCVDIADHKEMSKESKNLSSQNDDFLKNREARLARLEAETKEFYDKMARDKEKRNELDNRLNSVHKNFLDRQKDKSEKIDQEPSTSINNEKKQNEDKNNNNKNHDKDNSESEK